jgi:hypothetical protein
MDDYEQSDSNFNKGQDMFQIGHNIFTSLYQKIQDSPDILADFT